MKKNKQLENIEVCHVKCSTASIWMQARKLVLYFASAEALQIPHVF